MSDFTSGFWNIFITVLTLVSIFGCGALLWSQSKHKVKLDADGVPVKTTGHVWDEDLTELNTPMPGWWMWLFYITIVFALIYLTLYPGLGTYAGKLGWKSSTAYQEELKKADAEYGPLFAKYLKQDLKTVAADPQAHLMGERMFLTYCAQCHGSDARGSKGFPNLTDHDWLYGGEPETIKTSILEGRNGVMPSMAAALGSDKDIKNVATYVASLSGVEGDPVKTVLGKAKFGACAACHGADGRGNQALGAPNLTDHIWLHGSADNPMEIIMESIRNGRNNKMPAFRDFLGEPKVHVLAAYVWSLSNEPGSEAQK
ncbi:cytochrome-c oxidase, cbb3-type subunit III [Herbaspirillum sp. RTI4]|uniref:cytochrome-c oxidase, cbb3-type subunit III n=1 Tax=Herbaspirillum sp. RTI4 TaxID=3048640 RepID=UPI002AB38826|nr:cytochrome-c oxidase, cbb3-type subunit III [Herbaspirillum sp. RTI4]MDY7578984.1 cytochrome-c oxidase, cbb3-type subunit III [Herbaspirillum sp. RTI4]MEA9980915.1 cytochrome-c oxidase, cbb3-type subunit III [Herbaspirillum sp. RTI4]